MSGIARPLRVALLLVLAWALLAFVAGCGDDSEDSTVTETVTQEETDSTESETTESETTETEEPVEGPSGDLSETGIGEVQAGMTVAEVEAIFGPPTESDEVPGCELSANPPALRVHSYLSGEAPVSLTFLRDADELLSYRVQAPGLTTAEGIGIGSTYDDLSAAYGQSLEPLPLGADPTPQNGLWYVGEPGKAFLLFDVRGGKVKILQGGNIQFCE